MKSISAEKHSSVISLLNEVYSHCQIQARTALGKGTIGRISREVEGDKENHPGGHPSKLSPYDKQSIIHQISSEKLDNAVQTTQFINSIISTPVTPQTVRNVLKAAGFRSATKKKVPILKGSHHQQHLKFAQYHENWTM
jgi:transposase